MIIGPDGAHVPAPAQTSTPGAVPDFVGVAQQANANLAAGTGTLADQGVVMQGSAGNLVAAAGPGFHLDAEGAATLIAGIRKAQDLLRGLDKHHVKLLEAPQLGDLDYAKRVSAFTRSVATDQQGVVPGVESLRATLAQMEQAYEKAFGNYQAVEQQINDSMNGPTQGLAQGNTPPYHGGPRAV
jgi:hypothetical protein